MRRRVEDEPSRAARVESHRGTERSPLTAHDSTELTLPRSQRGRLLERLPKRHLLCRVSASVRVRASSTSRSAWATTTERT